MTRPTRAQEAACDRLADSLAGVIEASRQDGRASFGPSELRALLALLVKATTAFGPEEIVARALERRGRALGLRNGTAELLTLLDGATPPGEALLLSDGDFKARVLAIDEELGGFT